MTSSAQGEYRILILEFVISVLATAAGFLTALYFGLIMLGYNLLDAAFFYHMFFYVGLILGATGILLFGITILHSELPIFKGGTGSLCLWHLDKIHEYHRKKHKAAK